MTIIAALIFCVAAFAQGIPQQLVTWSSHIEKAEAEDVYRVIFTGKIADGYHTYTLTDEFSATEFMDVKVTGGELAGGPYEISTPTEEVDEFGDMAKHYYNEIIVAQDVKINDARSTIAGTIFTNTCTSGTCKAEYYDFEVSIDPANAVMAIADASASVVGTTENAPVDKGMVWGLILQAIAWGFAMLLTPCVFPMVPMTVSFFMKGSASVAAGRFKAGMYGLFIILIYTLPIALLVLIPMITGGANVTADIFNWIATHWLPNLLFFVIFMIFAASFFGAFEITLPESMVNKTDKGADKKGLAGVFFMALTLVLVSFSCTGPIVGMVLIQATTSNTAFWVPIVTMLAFSAAFALPFTVLAFSPSLLKKFRKSGGGWLHSVKVVLGFIEVALGLKFLSVADQTYHWGILDREVYLAIWIVVFTLLGLYLLGKIKFEGDEPVEHISVPRLTLVIAVFSFVVYLIPGMWGAPLKALSGYMPPITTQDFVIGQNSGTAQTVETDAAVDSKYGLHLPLGLHGYFTLEEGLEAAKEAGKPVFVDVTGHGCVNCREMESRVWSDPTVYGMLQNDFVIVALYSDDKQKLDKEDWVTDAETGKVYKDLGRANSYTARTLWNVNAQPNYVLLSPDGEMLVPVRGYDLSIEGFVNFLQSGLDAYKAPAL
ncbi:MAG: thioredoxin family protein [Bacteroidales bacterium]|nr:thioredoxin family protein [Bacteroidales bacterium]